MSEIESCPVCESPMVRRSFDTYPASYSDPFCPNGCKQKEHCPRRLMGEHQEPHMPCDTGDHSKDDDMPTDQQSEYQRLLASPTSTARALIEARAEIELLKCQVNIQEHSILHRVHPRDHEESKISLAAAESKIAALKVDLAAMMKERDAALQRAEVEGGAYETCADERDAALADLSQARAERDEQHARAEYLLMDRDMTEEKRKLLRDERDAAIKHAERSGEENARLTAAADAYRAQREVIEAAKGFKHSGVPHERWVRLWNALDELEKIDARRKGSK